MLEVNVERNDVEKRQIQIFGGRIVRVGDDSLRVLVFRRATEAGDVFLNSVPTVPAHYRGRDLVANRVAEHGRMAGDAATPARTRSSMF